MNLNENFSKWFSGSKVVDSNGKPLVVYHGTTEEFSTFNINLGIFGRGIHFAKNPEISNLYAGSNCNNLSPNIIPVFLNLKNPFVINNIDFLEDEYKDLNGNIDTTSLIDELVSSGFDGIICDDVTEDNVVAFYPNQIKSAIGNNGNYDINDDDITK